MLSCSMINSFRVLLVWVLYASAVQASGGKCQCSRKWEKKDPLDSAVTTGMSSTTSKGYGYTETGIAASERAAKEDFDRAKKYMTLFAEAADETGMDKHVLAAIASRESRVGNALKNGWGDNGNGYGLMQVDKRHHDVDTTGGPASYENILQGAKILQDMHKRVVKKFPDWTAEAQLRGGIAAYNFGVKNVQTLSGIDKGTTGDDYSSDVVARAKYYRNNGL